VVTGLLILYIAAWQQPPEMMTFHQDLGLPNLSNIEGTDLLPGLKPFS
jgi:hypothetical protein